MRLPNGYGSVYKLSGKRRNPFIVRVTVGWSNEGKQILKTIGFYQTRQEGLNALAEYHSNPYDIDKGKITFAEVFDKWKNEHFPKISNNAIVNYNVAYKYCSSLYDMRFVDIRKSHLQSVVDNSGKAYPTRKLIKTLLNQLSNYAMQNDIVDKQYSQYIDVGKNEGKLNRVPFSNEEIQKLFDNDTFDFVDTILIMIYTGMRVGELLTLENKNIFLDKRYMIGGIKTEAGKNRIIPINRKIEKYIRKYYNLNNQYLITNFKGQQMKYSNYRREKFDNIMEKLNMKHNPHECRHTFASLMDRAEANKLCTKRIIGHSSPDLTDKIYTHKDIKDLIEAIDLI